MKAILTSISLFFALLLSTQVFAGSVSRAQFTTDVVDREPVDLVDTLSTDSTQIKYFSELTELQGQTVTHQWVYNDEVMFEKSFEVGGPRWRVWTSKSLQPGWAGVWTVHVLDGARNKILTQTFEYK